MVGFLPPMLWSEFTTHRGVCYPIVGLAAVVVAVELLSFETDAIGPVSDEDTMAGGD